MKIRCVLMIVVVLMISGCTVSKEQSSEKTIFAMDTIMELTAYGDHSRDAIDDAVNEIKRLELKFNRNDERSEIYKINHSIETDVSEESARLISYAYEIGDMTDGAFDITIAPIMDLWGFYSKQFRLPNDDEILSELNHVNYKKINAQGTYIELPNGVQVDLGGIAKGYTSSRIMDIFKKNDIKSGIVSLGGNVHVLGTKPDGKEWRVAIKDPLVQEDVVGAVEVSDKAVITSGGYQRYFKQNGEVYHHIIDPKTGYPSKSEAASVTVVSDNATLADALSTGIFVMGLDNGIDFWRHNQQFEFVLVDTDGRIYVTQGLENSFISSREYTVIK